MKVNVDQTVEVSDADRARIAEYLGQKTVDRQGIKDFLWAHGASWADQLTGPVTAGPLPFDGHSDPDAANGPEDNPLDLL